MKKGWLYDKYAASELFNAPQIAASPICPRSENRRWRQRFGRLARAPHAVGEVFRLGELAVRAVVHAAVLLAVQMRSAQYIRFIMVPGKQPEDIACGIDAHLGGSGPSAVVGQTKRRLRSVCPAAFLR